LKLLSNTTKEEDERVDLGKKSEKKGGCTAVFRRGPICQVNLGKKKTEQQNLREEKKEAVVKKR